MESFKIHHLNFLNSGKRMFGLLSEAISRENRRSKPEAKTVSTYTEKYTNHVYDSDDFHRVNSSMKPRDQILPGSRSPLLNFIQLLTIPG